MRTSISLFTFVILIFNSSISQNVELVEDINPGDVDGFNPFNYTAISVGENLLFPVVTSELGEELGAVTNGEFKILKDINVGSEGSSPQRFTRFEGKVYFYAQDAENGWTIWETDGTSANTISLIDPDENAVGAPGDMVVSRKGYLYYTFDGTLFRFDGSTNETIYSGINFRIVSEQQAPNYSRYKEEIAFIKETNLGIELYLTIEDTVEMVALIDDVSSFADFYGVGEVTAGITFSIDDNFTDDVSGTYLYDEERDTVRLLSIDEEPVLARRTINIDDEADLVWVGGKGYYLINGISGEEELLYESSNNSATQGEGLEFTTFGDVFLFSSSDGLFGDENLILSDGTGMGSTALFDLTSQYTNLISHNEHAFIATGTSNGFQPSIHYIDMMTGEFEVLNSFDESSSMINSVTLLGVQNNILYFTSNLDPEIGRELYSLPLDFDVTTNTFDQKATLSYQVNIFQREFEILSSSTSVASVYIYDLSGRLTKTIDTVTNVRESLHELKGFYLLVVEVEGEISSYKYIAN